MTTAETPQSFLDVLAEGSAPPPLDWSLPVEHLSASSLTKYECRERWRRRYISRDYEPHTAALVWGSADHAATEHNYAQKIETHEQLPTTEVREKFASSLDEIVEEAGGEKEVQWDKTAPSVAVAKDLGVELVAAYHEIVAPAVQPIAVEQRFEVPIPGLPIPIVGYPDLETDYVIIDKKTAGKKFPNGKPYDSYRVAGMIYQLHSPKPVHWHVSTKTKTPAVYTPAEEPGLELPFTKANRARTEEIVRTTARAIVSDLATFGPDGPWPGARAQYMSPCGRCGYRATCHWWK